MNPIEKAARAIAEYYGEDPDIRDDVPGLNHKELARWRRYAPVAAAVIKEIREPTGEMLGDVHDTLLYHVAGNEMDTARLVWDRMIDALLEET